MNRFHHVRIKLESFLNNLSLKKKLRYLYFLCILVPIFLTDIVILHALTKNEHAEQLHQMEKIAKSVQSMLSAATEDSALISTSLYMDNSLQDFVSRQYASPRDYFSSYREYIHNGYPPFRRSPGISSILRMATARGFFFLMMKQMGARCCFYVG